MSSQIQRLEDLLADAHKMLVEAITQEYPAGTVVLARLAGHTLKLEVRKVRKWGWSRAGLITGTNLRTGKTRSFLHRDVVEVLSRPNTKAKQERAQ